MELLYRLRARILRPRSRIIRNLFDDPDSWPNALLYYKTEPLINPNAVKAYSHTNNWEILEICKVVHKLGYRVDVVDRSLNEWLPSDEYALFIGSGAGNSGRRYVEYASNTPSALKVFYAAGPETKLANSLILDRYAALKARTGLDASPLRIADAIDIEACMDLSDAIVCMDGNGFSLRSYSRFGLPSYPIVPSTSPAIRFDPDMQRAKDFGSFLCFAGNGFIAKGVDLVVEAFAAMPELKLFIAGPQDDIGFWQAYGALIESSPNITFEGFLNVSGRRFKELSAHCSFVILPSAKEGCCTSVATAMRAALVPITTYSTGVHGEETGFVLPPKADDLIDAIIEVAMKVSATTRANYSDWMTETQLAATKFTQAGFTTTFSQAVLAAILDTGRR